ncbi:MAG: hypothetical protein U9R34_00675 [Nanoarchaeota archaeon]|nr:hypothetical protein [Nanoarchaeota archaeon]
MQDVLVLEDNSLILDIIIKDIKAIPEISYAVLSNGDYFQEYLAANGPAKLNFLDDRVPYDYKGFDNHFIKHSTQIFEQNPNVKVFYIGNKPENEVHEYCNHHNISMIEKLEIQDIIKREFHK